MSVLLSIIVTGGIVLGLWVLTMSMNPNISNDPTLLLEGSKATDALAQRLGMSLASNTESALCFEGEISGVPARLRIDLARRSKHFRLYVRKVDAVTLKILTPPVGSFTLEVDASKHSAHAPSGHALSGVPARYHVEGSPDVAWALLSTPLREAIDGIGWRRLTLGSSILLSDVSALAGGRQIIDVQSAWPALSARASALVRAWPAHDDVPALLLERVGSPDEPFAQRWRAATTLLIDHPEAEATMAMRDGLDALPGWVAAACEDARAGASRERAMVTSSGDPDAFVRWLAHRFPWDTLVDAHCDSNIREEVFEAALEAAPPDRDDQLVDLLTGAMRPGENRERLYRRLRGAGWDPSHEARARLARDAVGSIRHALIRELQARELTAADAPELAALLANGHEGDVTPLIAQLEASGGPGGGALSLSDVRGEGGRLTAVEARRGDLSSTEPD